MTVLKQKEVEMTRKTVVVLYKIEFVYKTCYQTCWINTTLCQKFIDLKKIIVPTDCLMAIFNLGSLMKKCLSGDSNMA